MHFILFGFLFWVHHPQKQPKTNTLKIYCFDAIPHIPYPSPTSAGWGWLFASRDPLRMSTISSLAARAWKRGRLKPSTHWKRRNALCNSYAKRVFFITMKISLKMMRSFFSQKWLLTFCLNIMFPSCFKTRVPSAIRHVPTKDPSINHKAKSIPTHA